MGGGNKAPGTSASLQDGAPVLLLLEQMQQSPEAGNDAVTLAESG